MTISIDVCGGYIMRINLQALISVGVWYISKGRRRISLATKHCFEEKERKETLIYTIKETYYLRSSLYASCRLASMRLRCIVFLLCYPDQPNRLLSETSFNFCHILELRLA